MAYIAFDVEATGLDVYRNEIISMGAIDLESAKTFYTECRPANFRSIDPQAIEVCGFTITQLERIETTRKQALYSLIEFLGSFEDVALIGYHIQFDITMLYSMANREGLDKSALPRKCIDDAEIVFNEFYIKKKLFPSDIVIKRGGEEYIRSRHAQTVLLGIGMEPDPHNALTGAIYAGEIFSRIIFHKPLINSKLERKDIPDIVRGTDVNAQDYIKKCDDVVSDYKRRFDAHMF